MERTKIAGTNIDYEQKPEHLLSYTPSASISSTNETVRDILINVTSYVESGSLGTAIENVAQTNRISRFYSR